MTTAKRAAVILLGIALTWVMFSPAPLIIAIILMKSIY